MLEKIDLTKKMGKKEYKEAMEGLTAELSELQRECKNEKIPVMIVFEGLGAAGKGTLINQLIQSLDPRGFHVYAINGESEEEKLRPFLWRFWTKTPEKGRIAIFDRSWYRKVLIDRFDGITPEEELEKAYQEINNFEEMLSEGGTAILKFFLYITQKEQKKRFERLRDSKETAWRVSKGDLKRNKHYKKYLQMNEEMLQKTDTDYAPWNIIEAMDREFATVKIITVVVECLKEALENKKRADQMPDKDAGLTETASVNGKPAAILKSSMLSQVDLSLSYSKEEYKEKLDALQKKIGLLHSALYKKRIPVVLAFEGWDAGGKGGAIKRLTSHMDPRGYMVNPTAAPNDIENAHHYLWRFWQSVPKAGHIAIYDRTWSGRVMVERIEGFCTTEEWQRAYKEINQFEENLYNAGAIVLKFWMHIDKDEQERRFKERQGNPAKQWKITEEDWRNREKWDLYEKAVDEMLIRTSTTYAPWIIVEGNDKYYARVKVLKEVADALEKRLK